MALDAVGRVRRVREAGVTRGLAVVPDLILLLVPRCLGWLNRGVLVTCGEGVTAPGIRGDPAGFGVLVFGKAA